MEEILWPEDVKLGVHTIDTLFGCCKANSATLVRTILEGDDLDEICRTLLNAFYEDLVETKVLEKIIDILTYLEDDMGITSPVSDTLYDMILECLNDHNVQVVGIGGDIGTNEGTKEHEYPELRGSLQKVHYPTTDDIPKKDSRKSLEKFLENTLSRFWKEYPDEIVEILPDFKWDGTSNVFECSGTQINHVLTRYKVKDNLGKDISHIYRTKNTNDVFDYRIPGQLYDMSDYGVKTEVIMRQDKFEEYKKYILDKKCNRRSAVSSILNRTEDNFSVEMLDFLEVIPLQISTKEPIPGDPGVICCDDGFVWFRVGEINGRIQYISNYRKDRPADMPGFILMQDSINEFYDGNYAQLANDLYNNNLWVTVDAKREKIPIDGMVFTLLNEKLTKMFGRSNDKNNFQVAFKFPAGVAKTKLLDVEMQVGPIAGTITPVGIVEPVQINGNTISHVGLSNMEKLERLQLHRGDEVLIQYDIIPKIMVTDECKKGDGELFTPITKCPICGGDIRSGRCVNRDCDAKMVGTIATYIDKMGIRGFGIETIATLMGAKILTCIQDLYRLSGRRQEMLTLPGFKEKTVDKLISAPLSRTNVYPHELIGSIGIPDISFATMERVCRIIDAEVLINNPEILMAVYEGINGIGEKTAEKIIDGIINKKELIVGVMPYITFKKYKPVAGNVVFTDIRDREFSDFLRDNPGIRTSTSVTKDTIAVITRDDQTEETGSIKSAKKNGVPILGITEAKNKWGYE